MVKRAKKACLERPVHPGFTPSKCSRYKTMKHQGKFKHSTLRDQFISTNIDLFLIGIFLAFYNNWSKYSSVVATGAGSVRLLGQDSVGLMEDSEELNDDDSPYALLFPWFVQTIAVFIYYAITRYIPSLPYAAVIFILGFAIGFTTTHTSADEQGIAKSASLWLGINGQVILLIFLPGLIFLDAFTINVHMFFQSFWQLINFAFPMVLGGTVLTALVAKYIFPYGWSFNLSMCLGAILSGTDPVAVSGLLDALGAPPRLKMHVSGESLLNDGSTVVFYNIFTQRYFYELGIEGFGNNVGWGEGFALFFRLSFGGAAIGFAFGVGTIVILYFLNRRLSAEENVFQVVATICAAYLAYFTSEILCLCSGIIATLVCGITVKVFGDTLINDNLLTLHFWQVTGQLLNTLLFGLGGALWGNIISNDRYGLKAEGSFTGKDWGYLFVLYVFMVAIRFLMVFSFYPITSRIGIGTNLREAVFMSYGGLRGAVGIALALSLDARIYDETEDNPSDYQKYRNDSDILFEFVGGISLLTLLINGMSSGPLLRKLSLVTPPKIKTKVIENYRQQMIQHATFDLVDLLSQKRFKDLDFSLVRAHVPFLKDVSISQLLDAFRKHKYNTPSSIYRRPHIEHVLPYLQRDLDEEAEKYEQICHRRRPTLINVKESCHWEEVFDHESKADTIDDDDLIEERLNFIEILRSAYHRQQENGTLELNGEVPYSLFQGLCFAEDLAGSGLPLNDWESTLVASDTRVNVADKCFQTVLRQLRNERNLCKCGLKIDVEFVKVQLQVRQTLAFVRAHRVAQRIFKEEFSSGDNLSIAEEKVLEESQAQVELAEDAIKNLNREDIDTIKWHFACQVLLNKSINFVEKLARQGSIPEEAASSMLEELDGNIKNLLECQQPFHEGKLSNSQKAGRLRVLSPNILDDFKLRDSIEELAVEAEYDDSPIDLTDDNDLSTPIPPAEQKI